MNNLARILNLLSVVSLSLFSGAFLFIAFVVVGFWQAVEPDRTSPNWRCYPYLGNLALA